jgi:thymidylate synthase (FAD)
MIIHYEPKVYLTHRPQIVYEGVQAFFRDHNIKSWETTAATAGDCIPELAGRLCYMSFDKPRPGGNTAYLGNIKKQRHGSVIEHPSWGFIFTGISRTCTHELVRHRLASYSQLSQRYVDESVCEVVCPLDLRKEVQLAEHARVWMIQYMHTPPSCSMPEELEAAYFIAFPDTDKNALEAGQTWCRNMRRANEDYRRQVEYLTERIAGECRLEEITDPKERQEQKTAMRKQARQAARSVLPNATETKIYTTMNARAFRHMVEMRASRHAEPEIRMLAYKVWEVLLREAPNLFADYQKNQLPDGTFELVTPNRKV